MTGGLLLAGFASAAAAVACGAGLPAAVRARAAGIVTVLAGLFAGSGAVGIVESGRAVSFHTTMVVPVTGLSVRLDPLGALFVAVTAAVAVAAALFSLGYTAHGTPSRTTTAAFPLFVLALLAVPCADSVGTFLFAWELMAITSLLLVLADHRHRSSTRSAGQWYGVMTQIGAASILAGFALLSAHAGSQNFEAIRAHAVHMSSWVRSTAFVLTLVGFASKAGTVPLHVWLPRAHPEAPSHVSALMSAAMVNLGIYGIVRVGPGMLGKGPAWWWIAVLVAGGASALFGALHSATSTDLKRLLAYSTTDNIGLMLLGVGTSGLLASEGHRTLSALALIAALFHVVSHAAFKGSLFLAAGSVQTAAGTRDLDLLGGLIRRLPVTAAIFATGAGAISALPPLSGFASEWLLLQSFLHGLSSSTTVNSIVRPIVVGVLALTGGVTAVAFVKALGIGFLGLPRSDGAARAREVPRSMLTGSGFLGLAAIAIGVVPFAVLTAVGHAVASVVPIGTNPVSLSGWNIGVAGTAGSFSPAVVGVALAACIVIVALVRWLTQVGAVRRTGAWGCGRDTQTARMEYTATSFAEPLQRVFDDVLRPDLDLDISHSAESGYFVKSVAVRHRLDDALERHVYRPVFTAVRWWGAQARRLQNGNVHRYLGFGLAALIAVLVFVA